MLQVSQSYGARRIAQTYGVRRPLEIAARLAATFIIAPQFDDFTPDAPEEIEPSPSTGSPAGLDLIEEASDEAAAQRTATAEFIAILVAERECLRRDLHSMLAAFDFDPRFYDEVLDLSADIYAVKKRLESLDEMLLFVDEPLLLAA